MLHWVREGMFFRPDRAAQMASAGSWNQLEIELKARTIRASVNGKPILNTAIAKGALLSDGGVPALNRAKGRIGLQQHTGTVRFRSIEIMDLGNSK